MKRDSEVGRSRRMRIVQALKKTQGLCVNQLGQQLNLSYMGVKQHCVELQRQGYLDTWRRPKPVGRPEMIYRLTPKAQEFFPSSSNASTVEILKAASRLYGAAAADKLLYSLYASKGEQYMAKLRGSSVPELAGELAKIREQEGYFAQLTSDDGLVLTEYHSPVADLLEAFPIVRRLEREMMERVLGTRVSRDEEVVSGLYRCRFLIEG